MTLKHDVGNIIDMAEDGTFDVVVHGCNCHTTMGSGIAREIRERYPEAFKADYHYGRSEDGVPAEPVTKLGNYSEAAVYGNGRKLFTIINAYTQLDYNKLGEEFIDHFEYESFHVILKKLETFGAVNFGFPYIGMGLAGGNRERIIKMIEDFAEKVSANGGSVTLVAFG
jgi:O-acetyl-ADP-ribose deacetylase (regulator of RNase III)